MVSSFEKITPSSGIRIRHKGVFDLDRLYSEVKGWIGDNSYDFQEKEHSDKGKDKGREIKYVFLAEKDVTSYFRYHIEITFEFNEINPMSENLVSGNAQVTIHSKLEMDYKNHWSPNPVSNFFFNFYNKYVIKEKILAEAGTLEESTVEVWDLIKDILDFNR